MPLKKWPYKATAKKQLPMLLSGGARGADSAFGKAAEEYGYPQTHFTFEGHSCEFPHVKLTTTELREAIPFLQAASNMLNRPIPGKPFIWKLLHRNWFQVRDADAVFAVSTIASSKKTVHGGTGWAVAMGIRRGIPVHVYDQNDEFWWRWFYKDSCFKPSHFPQITPEISRFAGIGSRELTDMGRSTIRILLRQGLRSIL